jgi:hypothetical protein
MKRIDSRLLIGGLMILGGFLFLMENFGIFSFFGMLSTFMIAGLFGLGGAAFLFLLISDQDQWWAAIPGFALIGLAATILAGEIRFLEPLTGGIFLGSLAMGFVAVYVLKPENWWAIIPGGVLSTLAVVATVEEAFGMDGAGIFFLGLALTFAVLYFVPTPEGRMTWAIFPAGALFVLALVVGTPFENLINLLWPLAIIGVGVYLVGRYVLTQR